MIRIFSHVFMRARHRGLGGAYRICAATTVVCVLATGVLMWAVLFRPWTAARGAQQPKLLRQIVLGLHVYESGAFRVIPRIIWEDGYVSPEGRYLCFDKPALDLETGRKVGEARVCFVETRPVAGGFSVRNLSFISLPEGRIVARHRTTLQPVLDPNSPATHLVGALPADDDMNVIESTGRFKGATGQARISGLVNLRNFRPDAESGIKFHEWIYLIQLAPRER